MKRSIDLLGKRFGDQVVIAMGDKDKWGAQLWVCKCDCGSVREVSGATLRNGTSTNCGCKRVANLKGKVFGRWQVLERVKNNATGNSQWLCECECGVRRVVNGGHLIRGETRSCGCYSSERTADRNRTHGKSHRRLYNIWCGMKDRCHRKENAAYRNYGGRGISVCDEWASNYLVFEKWAIGNGYAEDLSIDRIDNDGDYHPDNCRWATPEEQQSNKRTNRYVEYNGKKLTMAQLSRMVGISAHVLTARLEKNKNVNFAIHPPQKITGRRKRQESQVGKKQKWVPGVTIAQLATAADMNYNTLLSRLRRGMQIEDAILEPILTHAEKMAQDDNYRRKVQTACKANRPNKKAITMLDIESKQQIRRFEKLMDAAAWIRENTEYEKADYSTIRRAAQKGRRAYGYRWRL